MTSKTSTTANAAASPPPAPLYIRPKNAAPRLGLSISALWQFVKDGKLPAPQKLGARISVWNCAELDAAFEQLLASQKRAA